MMEPCVGLIFAAGVGSRLKPWTDSHPKALVEVGGKPMLQLVIERMADAGIRRIIINVHHFADQIVDFLANHDFGAQTIISDECNLLLETGGGMRKALDIAGECNLVVHNADILTDFPLSAMIAAHDACNSDITLLTQNRKTSRYIAFGPDGSMAGWTNITTGQIRPEGADLSGCTLRAFGGVHVVSPTAFDALRKFRPAETPFSIMDFYIENCRSLSIKSFGLPKGSLWFDIGRPETLELARENFSLGLQ